MRDLTELTGVADLEPGWVCGWAWESRGLSLLPRVSVPTSCLPAPS